MTFLHWLTLLVHGWIAWPEHHHGWTEWLAAPLSWFLRGLL